MTHNHMTRDIKTPGVCSGCDNTRRKQVVTKWAEITSGGRFNPAKNTPVKWQDIVDLLHSDPITPKETT